MAKKKNNFILPLILVIIILGFFSFLAFKTLSSSASIHVENRCKDLKFDDWDTMEPKIINEGDVNVYTTTCFSSDFFIFDNNDHTYCQEKQKILPFNNSIKQSFRLKTDPTKLDATRASILVDISCKKQFLFFKKACSSVEYSCNFDKMNLLGEHA